MRTFYKRLVGFVSLALIISSMSVFGIKVFADESKWVYENGNNKLLGVWGNGETDISDSKECPPETDAEALTSFSYSYLKFTLPNEEIKSAQLVLMATETTKRFFHNLIESPLNVRLLSLPFDLSKWDENDYERPRPENTEESLMGIANNQNYKDGLIYIPFDVNKLVGKESSNISLALTSKIKAGKRTNYYGFYTAEDNNESHKPYLIINEQ